LSSLVFFLSFLSFLVKPLVSADFTSAVNYLRGEGAQSIPPDIKKIMEDSNLWGENIEEDFMNSIEETVLKPNQRLPLPLVSSLLGLLLQIENQL
jgi:hypothetical protein